MTTAARTPLIDAARAVCRQHRSLTAWIVASATGAAITAPIGTAMFGATVNRLWARSPSAAGLAWLSGLILVASAIAWTGGDVGMGRWASHFGVELRRRMSDHVAQLPPNFFVHSPPGEMADRMSSDVDTLVNLVNVRLKPALSSGVLAVTTTVVGFFLAPWIGACFLASLPLILWPSAKAASRLSTSARNLSAAWNESVGVAEDALAARVDLRQLAGAGLAMRAVAHSFAGVWRRTCHAAPRYAALDAGPTYLVSIVRFLSVAVAVILAAKGHLLVGTAIAFATLWARVSTNFRMVAMGVAALGDVLAAQTRISELLGLTPEPDVEDSATDRVDWNKPVDVRVADLDFAYADEPDRSTLRGVSVTVDPGRTLGLVGRTGGGKSTLCKLITRVEVPPPSTVFIGGVDVRQIPLGELRRHVVTLQQRVDIFRTSVRNNVSLFDPDVVDDDVRRAIAGSGLETWFGGLKDGLDTAISADTLSTGQAQLLAIARLLVRNPKVVILDEATSYLDPATESRVRGVMAAALRGRTVIAIAHRLSTVQRADTLAVIDFGEVTETGTPDELAARHGGRFAQLLAASGEAAGDGNQAVAERLPAAAAAPYLESANPTTAAIESAPLTPPSAPMMAAASSPKATARRVRQATWSTIVARPMWSAVLIVGFVVVAAEPVGLYVLWRRVVGIVSQHPIDPSVVGRAALALLVPSTLCAIASVSCTWLATKWIATTNMAVRANVIDRTFAGPFDEVTGAHLAPGDLVARLDVARSLPLRAMELADAGAGLAATAVITALAGKFGLLVLAPVATTIVAGRLARPGIDRAATASARARSAWGTCAVDVCANALTLHSFGAARSAASFLDVESTKRQQLDYRHRVRTLQVNGAVFPVARVAQAALVLVVVYSHNRPLTVALLAILAALDDTLGFVFYVAGVMLGRSQQVAAVERLDALLDVTDAPAAIPTSMTLPPAPPAAPLTTLSPRARLRHLTVSNIGVGANGVEQLRPVSFDVEAGELVVVTGTVASGKSTLLRVLAGLTARTSGTLRWNEVVVDDPSRWCRPPNVAYVAQVPMLVSGRVDDNVSLGRDVDLAMAAKLAQLNSDIERWGGWGTRVGQHGLRLSGGERQRLAAARALATESELLVVDDLSSALDTVTEEALWRDLRASGRTVIAASHRAAVLERADVVVNLDEFV